MTRYLTKEEAIRINKALSQPLEGVEASEPVYLRENALDYLLEVVDSEMMGKPLYPEMYQKAGVYLFNIIADFVFTERNVPTAFVITHFFLQHNSFRFKPSVSQESLAAFINEIASGNVSLKEVQLWLKLQIEEA